MMVLLNQILCVLCMIVFFYKQKTAYELRISDWSSDVCSSDLFVALIPADVAAFFAAHGVVTILPIRLPSRSQPFGLITRKQGKIGRASCRERVCQYV